MRTEESGGSVLVHKKNGYGRLCELELRYIQTGYTIRHWPYTFT